MKIPTLPQGAIPAGSTHFYFDHKRTTDASNPWRRLDVDSTWYMFRGDEWVRIAGSRSYQFVAITDLLPGGLFYEQPAMTLRDQFAVAALQGMLAEAGKLPWESLVTKMPAMAYQLADAMIRARK